MLDGDKKRGNVINLAVHVPGAYEHFKVLVDERALQFSRSEQRLVRADAAVQVTPVTNTLAAHIVINRLETT
jgi:hypothetical protein